MLISLIFIALIAFGGMALTYLVVDDEPFMWRLSAGSIVGSAVFGLIVFVAGFFVGFNSVTIFISLAITLAPALMLRQSPYKKTFLHDWAKAKGTMEGVNLKKGLRFTYYAFFLIVFWFFFDRAVFELKDGLYTGGSQNYGDLPFHLGAIFGFTDGASFPPENPSWAGAKFSYPFMADFLSACFVKLGMDFKSVIFAQDVTWAFALLVIIERFTYRLTNNKLAGRIAPALLFFSGGLGFLWFFQDISGAAKGFVDFMWHMPVDYTISDKFRWGNPMVVLFITQRGLLFGMPLTVLIIGYLWKIFAGETSLEASSKLNFFPFTHFPYKPIMIGMLAGTLPLVHVHSLAALFIITGFLFVIKPAKWREWIAFGIGVAVVALPELIWTLTGTATETTKFFGWHFGWDKRDLDFFWFWFKNTGLVFPAIFAAIYLFWLKSRKEKGDPAAAFKPWTLLLFYIPFAFLFVLSNVVKMAPWEWDNIKILIYWYVGSIPFIAYAIAWAWQLRKGWEYVAAAALVVLTLSGALDVWRTASAQTNFKVFETDAMKIAEQIKQKTDRKAMFLNGPIFNTAPVLTGRQSLMRYPGHLGSYGIDYGAREADVKQIYLGGANADQLLQKYNIDYVLVSPFEKNDLKANDEYFKKYPVIAESGPFKVYKIKN